MRFLIALFFASLLSVPGSAAPRHVIVIAMENKDASKPRSGGRNYIYGNAADAPFINDSLFAVAARSNNFIDELPERSSLPHYILMEAGRTLFDDAQFRCNNDPSKSCDSVILQRNWTESREHLTGQIEAAGDPALTWMTYQEAIDPDKTGACPVRSAGLYAAKHNPFVYFADIAGSPPAANNEHCVAHTRNLSLFAEDMESGKLANYVFVTPNLCNSMHGAKDCRENPVRVGDRFLASFLPPLLDWAIQNEAVVFVVWDESSPGKTIPFLAAGWGVKKNHQSDVRYSHRSVLRTVERIFGLPLLEAVGDASDLSDMFEPGALP